MQLQTQIDLKTFISVQQCVFTTPRQSTRYTLVTQPIFANLAHSDGSLNIYIYYIFYSNVYKQFKNLTSFYTYIVYIDYRPAYLFYICMSTCKMKTTRPAYIFIRSTEVPCVCITMFQTHVNLSSIHHYLLNKYLFMLSFL